MKLLLWGFLLFAATAFGNDPARDPASLDLSGDFRVRYEHTSELGTNPARNRGVVRARVAGAFSIHDDVAIHARLVTGDPDDPNSADVSMGNFVDDLDISFDRAYVAYQLKKGDLMAGKFPNPLASTGLVWDADVNPAGIGGRYEFVDTGNLTTGIAFLYFVVDEQTTGRDSDMSGGQLSLDWSAGNNWHVKLHGAYLDYSIGSLANADPGDVRDNLLAADGMKFLSDFDLLDVIAEMQFAGGQWPVTLTVDAVKNLGAATGEDQAFGLTMSAGRNRTPGDIRFTYGYARAETDAVLAAFSQDNTPFATNYRQHMIGIEYVMKADTELSLKGYHYDRLRRTLPAVPNDDGCRIRLNLRFRF